MWKLTRSALSQKEKGASEFEGRLAHPKLFFLAEFKNFTLVFDDEIGCFLE